MIYFEIIDRMMQYYSDGQFKDEAIRAKDEFCDFAGVMDEFAPDYEMKFNQFADWYLFVRSLNAYSRPPVKVQHEEKLAPFPAEWERYVLNLSCSRHSLFEFLKLSREDLHVRDLFSDYKLIIRDSPVVHGFAKDCPFEARLIPHDDSFVFSTAFCFHPQEAKKFIMAEVKKVRKLPEGEQQAARESLIMKLFRMKHKYERYIHVQINEIYSEESRLKF